MRTVAMHSASERQRMVNPRKAYTVDPGLIALFERSGRTHAGRALEAAAAVHPDARPFLVTRDAVPPSRPMPDGLTWAPAARWLLEEM